MRMQLGRHAFFLAALLLPVLHAEDSVSFEVLSYDEADDRVSARAVSLAISKAIDVDHQINLSGKIDSVSGASPTWKENIVDTSSGGSGVTTLTAEPAFENVEFDDNRYSGEASLTIRGEARDETTVGGSFSSESDYLSRRIFLERMQYEDLSHNRAYSYGVSLSDSLITVPEFNQPDASSGASSVEESAAFLVHGGVTQVLTRYAHMTLDLALQSESGYLSNNYKQIVRQEGSTLSLAPDSRPESRVGWAVSGEYAHNLPSLDTTLHAGYRYYADDWNIRSQTVDLSVDYEFDEGWTISPFGRYYTQTEADFYRAGYFGSVATDEFGTSDERLSTFDARTYGLSAELQDGDRRYKGMAAYYDQSTDLRAVVFSIGLIQEF